MKTAITQLLCALLLVACSDAFLEPKTSADMHVDDRLALSGRVCTSRPDTSGFPVKVVFIVDQSGSMCVSDPPGAQQSPGFCEAHSTVPPGVTQPARVRALNKLVDQFASQPNVQVALVPFETNIKGQWPQGGAGSHFSKPDASLKTRIQQLQAELGKGTDYQGALAYAYGLISSDIAEVQGTTPAQLPRTRYVVVFLTDGTPFPRCSGNDSLSTYADADHPELTWEDSSGAGDFCNQIDPGIDGGSNGLGGFVPGTDRNQNYQLFSYVDQLMELKHQYNIGDIRLHSVLLFNEDAVRACGPICQDLYGTYPNTPPAQYPQAAKKIAKWLLQQFAQRGNGVYQEFNNSEINALSLGALDYSSLASRNVMKSLILQSLSSEAGEKDRQVDSDGDGLPDEVDNDFAHKTNKFFADTDGDGFDDDFEVRHFDENFRPDQRDGRGFDPASPLGPAPVRDTDGDGLSQYAEEYLKTDSTLVDSDGDGVPDGLEARYGLQATSPTAGTLDTDGDGVDDARELTIGSSPIVRDRPFQEKNAYQYEIKAEVQADGRVCYDFTVSNLQLVTPPNRAGWRQGFNLFKLWFGEAPESGVATDYGVWRTACAWAQYDPPSVREPAGPQIGGFLNASFVPPSQLADPAAYDSRCLGISPSKGQGGLKP